MSPIILLLSLFLLLFFWSHRIFNENFYIFSTKSWYEQPTRQGLLGYNCLSCQFSTLQIPCESCRRRAGVCGWQVPRGLSVYSVARESNTGLVHERRRLPASPHIKDAVMTVTEASEMKKDHLMFKIVSVWKADFLEPIRRAVWVVVMSRLLKRGGSSVTFEQSLPCSLRERGAHRLKIKTSTVISCSSGCFPKKSGDMNCILHPLQSWLSRAFLSVASMFHGGLRNKPPRRRNRRGADQLCVVFV